MRTYLVICGTQRAVSRRRGLNHGGVGVEILARSCVRRPQTGPVPAAHPGVHLLEHHQHQVSAPPQPSSRLALPPRRRGANALPGPFSGRGPRCARSGDVTRGTRVAHIWHFIIIINTIIIVIIIFIIMSAGRNSCGVRTRCGTKSFAGLRELEFRPSPSCSHARSQFCVRTDAGNIKKSTSV